ncbi:MAG: alpha/beta hydrolase [Actinomycetia bacterium]|nr:alpha/beta hydrolase [Actinomycetes bacterium]
MDTVVFKVVEGVEIRADVYSATDGQLGPAVLFFHGGALITGDRSWIAPNLIKAITTAGIAVVSVDYRLAPETKLPLIVSDIEDAYEWIRGDGGSRFSVDPERIAVVGGSAGGYLALLAGSVFHPTPRAVVSFYGYGDVTGPWYSTPDLFYNTLEPVAEGRARSAVGTEVISQAPMSQLNDRHDFYVYCRQQGTWPQEVCGHDPSDRGWYEPYEPLSNVTANYPPTMLLHGEADTDVPIERSIQMAEQLDRHGVAHALVTNAKWEHAFDLTSDGAIVQAAIGSVTDFLTKHLAEPPHLQVIEPSWPAENHSLDVGPL